MRKEKSYKVVIWQLLGVGLFIGLWELNSLLQLYKIFFPSLPGKFFPSILLVLDSAWSATSSWEYWNALGLSVWRILISFFLASVLGIAFAMIAARVRMINWLTFFPFEFFRQLPAVAIIPISIILFGIGTPMKIFVSFFGCFFPTYIATLQALKSTDPILLSTAKVYRWTGLKLYFGVMLPASLPAIFAILRVTLAISLILVITSEMLIGGEGLGARLVLKERAFDFPGLYGETLLLGVLGLILNYSFAYLSRRVLFWKSESKWSN